MPEAGGYNDQDAPTMERGAVMENIYNFERRWRSMDRKDRNYANLNEADQRIFYMLKDMEVKF